MNLLAVEPKHHQQFFSPSARAAFLDALAADTAAFQSSFDLPPFPPVEADAAWEPYPGLTDERRAELRLEYARISGEPSFRRERRALRSSSKLRRARVGRVLTSAWRRTRSTRRVGSSSAFRVPP